MGVLECNRVGCIAEPDDIDATYHNLSLDSVIFEFTCTYCGETWSIEYKREDDQ